MDKRRWADRASQQATQGLQSLVAASQQREAAAVRRVETLRQLLEARSRALTLQGGSQGSVAADGPRLAPPASGLTAGALRQVQEDTLSQAEQSVGSWAEQSRQAERPAPTPMGPPAQAAPWGLRARRPAAPSTTAELRELAARFNIDGDEESEIDYDLDNAPGESR